MGETDFTNRLEVIKAADDLVLAVYHYTKLFPKSEIFGLVSQMRRAAVSVPANIIEGYSRNTMKDKLQFYYVSRGSLAELKYYFQLAVKLNFLNEADTEKLLDKADHTAKLLAGFIAYTANQQSLVSSRRSPTANRQHGQTLIETIVAIFILTSGLVASLALATYAFGSSADIANRVVATGLSREGIETARRMRDSNWLRGSKNGNLVDCGGGQLCYRDWLQWPYDISSRTGSGRDFRMVFDPTSSDDGKWTLVRASSGDDFGLYLMPGGGVSNDSSGQPTNFFRKITLIQQNTNRAGRETQVLVRSVVWWYGKHCNNTLTFYSRSSDTTCKIITEDYLTNWRNY